MTGAKRARDDAFLIGVWSAVMDLIKGRCMKGIVDCHEREWPWKALMQWLKSVDSSSESGSPFSQYIEKDTVHMLALFC